MRAYTIDYTEILRAKEARKRRERIKAKIARATGEILAMLVIVALIALYCLATPPETSGLGEASAVTDTTSGR